MKYELTRRRFAALLFGVAAAPLGGGIAFARPFTEYRADGFTKLLSGPAPVVVHVHADWCAVCKAQMPVIERVLAMPAYRNVRAVRVNFDRDKQFLTDYRVIRQSTIIVFKGGKEIARLSYETDPARIEQTLAAAVS